MGLGEVRFNSEPHIPYSKDPRYRLAEILTGRGNLLARDHAPRRQASANFDGATGLLRRLATDFDF
jgi:hypothetical protein